MTYEDIEAWLNSPEHEWDEGISLLSSYCSNKTLVKSITSRGYCPNRMNDLVYQLSKIATIQPSSKGTHETSKNNHCKKPAIVHIVGEQKSDPILEELISKKNTIFKEYVALFHRLDFMAKAQRAEMALRCLDMWDEISELWSRIDYYNKYKFLRHEPVDVQEQPPDKVEMIRQRDNLRTYISKYRKKIDKYPQSRNLESWQQKLDEFLKEISILDRKLLS